MLAYLSFVAIANIFLGAFLSRAVESWKRDCRTPDGRNRPIIPVDRGDSEVPSSTIHKIEPDLAPATNSTTNISEKSERKGRSSTFSTLKSWDDFTAQLKEIKEKIRYCGVATD